MELREFAERILFASTLEEKLQGAPEITDLHPGPAWSSPATPGRPAKLRFKTKGAGPAAFPGVHELGNVSARGRLLHFFANHELLATELMALVLLKFPEAPAAFRRGVLRTLLDEQLHTRLYLERMEASGIRFGDLPVSGYFWRAVSPMQTPMDYVAGLSLTFEQANLDFCRHFARGFAAVGDTLTAGLLEKIHQDEIAHVAHGLKWFRQWKNPGETDWDAYCRQLAFPLSPSRAKGTCLNVEARRAAGLNEAFIAQLNVHSQSKGRTPVVFVFNPFTEERIAQGKTFTPVKAQALLAADLANLPQFLCRRDDVVLVTRRPSVKFLSTIKDAGFPLPEFIELERSGIGGTDSLRQRKLGGLRPWAWGPDSEALLEPLQGNLTGAQANGHPRFHEGIAALYSKTWSAEFLRQMLRHVGQKPWLCSEREVGVGVVTMAETLDAIEAIRRTGHHKVVVKAALGLAGRHMIRLWEPEILGTQRQWIVHALQGGKALVVEPWLEREMDFSIQLEMGPEQLQLRGFTGLVNDRNGQFRANWASPNASRQFPTPLLTLLCQPHDITEQIHEFYRELFSRLGKALRDVGYRGPVGIDAFAYGTADGHARLKPIVEINPRFTMGRVTLELMKQVSPGCTALFRIVGRSQLKNEGFSDFASYASSLADRHPLCRRGLPSPRICEGVLCLNDPEQAQGYFAVLHVTRTLDDLSPFLTVGRPYSGE